MNRGLINCLYYVLSTLGCLGVVCLQDLLLGIADFFRPVPESALELADSIVLVGFSIESPSAIKRRDAIKDCSPFIYLFIY